MNTTPPEAVASNAELGQACPQCGSDCNERDELTKAEREIERLRADLSAERKNVARRIAAAFDGIDWKRHTFNFNGVLASTSSGEKTFYQAGEVDSGITRLNALINELKA